MGEEFKVGDKVKMKHRFCGIVPAGTIGTVTEINAGLSQSHVVVPAVWSYGDWGAQPGRAFACTASDLERVYEPKEESELEQLVRIANEGSEAKAEIYRTYNNKVEDVGEIYSGCDPRGCSTSIRRIKVKSPSFEPWTMKNGWEVKLNGDCLYIGCKIFPAKQFKKAAEAAQDVNEPPHLLGFSPLYGKRHGLVWEGHTLNWEDADRIIEGLKKAGI